MCSACLNSKTIHLAEQCVLMILIINNDRFVQHNELFIFLNRDILFVLCNLSIALVSLLEFRFLTSVSFPSAFQTSFLHFMKILRNVLLRELVVDSKIFMDEKQLQDN
jgi:hypothetical protein